MHARNESNVSNKLKKIKRKWMNTRTPMRITNAQQITDTEVEHLSYLSRKRIVDFKT